MYSRKSDAHELVRKKAIILIKKAENLYKFVKQTPVYAVHKTEIDPLIKSIIDNSYNFAILFFDMFEEREGF